MILEQKLDKLVSLAVLLPAIGLIVFMFIQTFMGIGSSVINISNLIFVDPDIISGAIDAKERLSFHDHALTWLQAVATIVILVKAYKVLMSYVKTHHLSLKYVLEINFTATSLELLFNEASYSLETKILFLILGLSSILIYLIFYKQILELDKEKHKL